MGKHLVDWRGSDQANAGVLSYMVGARKIINRVPAIQTDVNKIRNIRSMTTETNFQSSITYIVGSI